MSRNVHGTLVTLGLIFVVVQLLAGCTTTVIGSCPIPEQLDYHASGPAPLTATNLKQHFAEEAKQRHASKMLADDYNALHDYIKDNCQ